MLIYVYDEIIFFAVTVVTVVLFVLILAVLIAQSCEVQLLLLHTVSGWWIDVIGLIGQIELVWIFIQLLQLVLAIFGVSSVFASVVFDISWSSPDESVLIGTMLVLLLASDVMPRDLRSWSLNTWTILLEVEHFRRLIEWIPVFQRWLPSNRPSSIFNIPCRILCRTLLPLTLHPRLTVLFHLQILWIIISNYEYTFPLISLKEIV